MAYTAVTGGKEAIAEAEKLTEFFRLKDAQAILTVGMIETQLRLLVDRVMGEGGLYAPGYASLALKQAEGDPAEAAFLLRAYRSTLPRNHVSTVIDPADMRVLRRISSSFRDMPGGQVLGPTRDYTHRLLKFALREETMDDAESFLGKYREETSLPRERPADLAEPATDREGRAALPAFPKIADLLRKQGFMKAAEGGRAEEGREEEPFDITRQKLIFPVPRSGRLQMLARGETGAMTALAYSSMRGYGAVHPTIGELRVGYVPVAVPYPLDEGGARGEPLYIGEILLTEVETIHPFTQNASGEALFVPGYGLCFGQNEVKAISMAILERSLETSGTAPAQDEEFVLLHIDSVESNGFVSHLKLPHYITFQSSLDRIRRAQRAAGGKEAGEGAPEPQTGTPVGVKTETAKAAAGKTAEADKEALTHGSRAD